MFLPLIVIFVVLTSAYSTQNYHPDHLSRTWTRLQLSLLFKVKKFWPPANREKGKAVHTTFLYISLLLALSLDIESKPGPVQSQVYLERNSPVFSCGRCEQPVTWCGKGVACDACFLWYHADCQNINNSMSDRLGESPSKAGIWKCLACNNLNITTNYIRSLDS